GDRLHWTLIHELGHLVLHHPPMGDVASIERQADVFAAEFLMPENAMREEFAPPVTLTTIAALKPRWRVAMGALIRRAHELEFVSSRQYRYLYEQMGGRGW